MSTYEEKIRNGSWPPPSREAALILVGVVIGMLIGFALVIAAMAVRSS
jgi:hypothetical protein